MALSSQGPSDCRKDIKIDTPPPLGKVEGREFRALFSTKISFPNYLFSVL
jgi:hypothetical protein